mmetsp:Transcript_14814/g.21863  ORF Transcript_14814/g.21863 Transcript_14814/m.21863 type:complete len:85 (+) Transcript_14814:89-343(+)
MTALRKIFSIALFAILLLTAEGNAVEDVVDEIQEAYDNLSPKGKVGSSKHCRDYLLRSLLAPSNFNRSFSFSESSCKVFLRLTF